ncbi:pro-sigmaK processing inhibitor BofA family protein [Salinimicrobium sp. MT39]|uniref:Pro-sigmaK processing inhibitor BofA family protein n=2 Tax=Bacteria TaxID=2 RepID=A0A9X3CZY1_9FLAO|nr:pro-sigmaK processing inhibitor BofA family protein [Salinimicrobium profundisediminis]
MRGEIRIMDPIIVISVLGGLVLLVLLMGAPMKPVRFIGQSFVKLLIGALFLFFLNAFGNQFGIHVPINLVTSAISGFLGIPGLFSLVAIQTWVL